MRKLILYLAISLDGYIAREDGGLDWLEAIEPGGEDYGYADFIRRIDTVLMGRRTYEVIRGFGSWPYTGLRSHVFSRSGHRGAAPDGVSFSREGPATMVARLKQESGRDIWLAGGAELLAACMDQVDEMRLFVQPVLLGRGIRLFPAARYDRLFRLQEARSYKSGLLGLYYTRIE